MIGGSRPGEPDEPSNEPEEFDPLEDIGPDVPEIDVPDATDTEADLDPELFETFWKLVAVFNVALFALALGPMLAYFRGELVSGTAVFLLGAGFFVYGYRGYRNYTSD